MPELRPTVLGGTAWGPLQQRNALGWLRSTYSGSPASVGCNHAPRRAQTHVPGRVCVCHTCVLGGAERPGDGRALQCHCLSPAEAPVPLPRVFLAVTCVISAAATAGERWGEAHAAPLPPLARTPPSLSGSRGSLTSGRARCRRGPSAPCACSPPARYGHSGGDFVAGGCGQGPNRVFWVCWQQSCGPLGREGYF